MPSGTRVCDRVRVRGDGGGLQRVTNLATPREFFHRRRLGPYFAPNSLLAGKLFTNCMLAGVEVTGEGARSMADTLSAGSIPHRKLFGRERDRA